MFLWYTYVMQEMQMVAIELIPDLEEGGFTARIPDVPALGEGATEEEAIEDLKIGLQLYIDEYGIEDALSRVNAPSHIRSMRLSDLVSHE